MRPRTDPREVLTGRVTLDPRLALPPGAVVHLMLTDLTAADAVVARYTFRPEGDESLRFALRIDSIEVDSGHRYGIAGAVTDARGRPLWTTTSQHPVSIGERRDIEIAMHRVEPFDQPREWWEGGPEGS